MSEGPTIHTVVMDERTTDLQEMVYQQVNHSTRAFVSDQSKAIEEAVRQAYIRGVRDGFQQGVLAADATERT